MAVFWNGTSEDLSKTAGGLGKKTRKRGAPNLNILKPEGKRIFLLFEEKLDLKYMDTMEKIGNQIITAGDSRNERKTPGPGLSQQNTFKMINYYSYVNPNRICQTILSYQVQRRGASKPVGGVASVCRSLPSTRDIRSTVKPFDTS